MNGVMRSHLRKPGFAIAVILTLALSTSGGIAVFSVTNAVLLRALPFAQPDRLVWIASVRTDNPSAPFTLAEFMDYRAQTRTFEAISAFANWRATLSTEQGAEGLQGARIAANGFDLLGVTPAAGRLLRESDDAPGAPKVVVLSYRLWQRQYGGRTDVPGRAVRLNGEVWTVAGVLPPHFPFPLRDVDVFVPLTPEADPYRHLRNATNFLRFYGRLRSGTTIEQAQSELTAICRSLRAQFPVEYARKESVQVVPLQEALTANYRRSIALLLAASMLVIAAAIANLLSLALVRAGERRADAAVRIALGASPGRLTAYVLAESLMLTLPGVLLGGLLAAWLIASVLPAMPWAVPRMDEVRIDAAVLAFALAVGIGAACLLAFASMPGAISATPGNLRHDTRSSGRLRQVLVGGQIAVALLLLIATATLLRNMRHLQSVDLGFRPDTVLQVRISLPQVYRSPDAIARLERLFSDRLTRMPGVQSAGATSIAPLSGLLYTVPFHVDGAERRHRDLPSANLRIISTGYLEAVGTQLLQGRLFTGADRRDSAPVAIVSAALAARFLDGEPVGRRIRIDDNAVGPRPVDVVGVVQDVRQSALDTPPAFDIYIPLPQAHVESTAALRNNQFWMIRTAASPESLRTAFLAALRTIEPDAAVSGAAPMRDSVDAALGPRRFQLGLFSAFSLCGVALVVTGLYALVSYAVSLRTREIGVRMAIGARPFQILSMVLGQACRLALAGSAAGFLLAVWSRPMIAGEEEFALAAAMPYAAGLLVLAIGAAFPPAWRAARISPTVALRGE